MAVRKTVRRLRAFLLSLVLLALPAAYSLSSRYAAVEPAASCCFANPGFTGICTVQPGEGETCESILNYLNTPNSTGKAYCGGTNLRGGWKSVECPPK